MSAGSWARAVRNCSFVFHLASPFPISSGHFTPEMEQELLIKPAVDGTINVLQACADSKTVKRVVLTSSMLAVSSRLHGRRDKPADYVHTEDDWTDESTCEPYERSKTKAELAAWDFMKKLPQDNSFELAVVNPGYVQGPLLSAVSGGGTAALCTTILNGKMSAVPNVTFGIIDVRDVVSANKAAMEMPEAAGKRHLLVANSVPLRAVAQIVQDEFKLQGYKVSTLPLPKAGMWVAKFFDATIKEMYQYVGKTILYSKERMEALGVEPYSLRDTILDTCYSIIELGLVKKTQRYTGQKSSLPVAAAMDPSSATEKDPPPSEAEQEPANSEEEGKEDGNQDPEAGSQDAQVEGQDPNAKEEEVPAQE